MTILAAGMSADWTTRRRRRLRNVLLVALGAEIALILFLLAQWQVLGVLSLAIAREQLASWSLALGAATLLGIALPWSSQHTQRHELRRAAEREARQIRQMAAREVERVRRDDLDFRRWQAGLSLREGEILDALADALADGLTNQAVALALSIEPNTLDRHKQAIGEKLGLEKGERGKREKIVAAAVAQGLLAEQIASDRRFPTPPIPPGQIPRAGALDPGALGHRLG